MLCVILRHVQQMTPYYACFPKVAKAFIKVNNNFNSLHGLTLDANLQQCYCTVVARGRHGGLMVRVLNSGLSGLDNGEREVKDSSVL